MSLIRALPIRCPQAVPVMAPRYVGQAFQPVGSGDFLVAGGLPCGWKAPLTVGQAFQPAGSGDFLVAGGLPNGWKAPLTVGQAFQPAGSGDFLVAGGLPCGWKAPLTGRLESLPYLVTRMAGWPKALLL
jgi:hypothetical protein